MTEQTKPTAKELFEKATSTLLDEIDALEAQNVEIKKELLALTTELDAAEAKLEAVKNIVK
jgi:prefoldin subunit 5